MATEEARNLDEARATMANTQVSGNSQANGKNQVIDNSNPQQGTDSEKKPDFQVPVGKIPPTARDDRKLFVGGLPSDVTEQEFRLFFEQFGVVIDSVVMFDRATNNSRGFGFVTFADPDVSKSLLQMGDHADGIGRLNMRGKICEVKRAQPKSSGRQGKSREKFPPVPPHLYSHEGFNANNGMLPYQGIPPAFAGYMAPMFYHPIPPPMVDPTVEFAAPPGYYNMGNYNVPMPGYPNHPSPNHHVSHPQAAAFWPVMPPPPPVTTGPSSTQTSVMKTVAPGIPMKNEDVNTTLE